MKIIDKINKQLGLEESFGKKWEFILRVWPKGMKPRYYIMDNMTLTKIGKDFTEKDLKNADMGIVTFGEVVGNINAKKLINLVPFNESLDEARDFSNAHFAVAKGKMYGDTQSIYILDELGGHIRHLGFGDFGTSNPIKLPGVGEAHVEYVRADGTSIGRMLEKKGFTDRPHYIDFKDVEDQKKAIKALAKVYKQKGAVEVKV